VWLTDAQWPSRLARPPASILFSSALGLGLGFLFGCGVSGGAPSRTWGSGRLCPRDHHGGTCRNHKRKAACALPRDDAGKPRARVRAPFKAAAEYAETCRNSPKAHESSFRVPPSIPRAPRLLLLLFRRMPAARCTTHREPAPPPQRTTPALQSCPVRKGTMLPRRRPT
jgi:hypothetical protein